MQLLTAVLKHMLECAHLGNKSREGREKSTCFGFISLQKHVWDDIRRKDFFAAVPILSVLFSPSSPALASPHCLLPGRAAGGKDALQTQEAVLKASPDTMTLIKATNQPRATQIFRGCQTVIQIPSTTDSFPTQWNFTGFVLAPGTADCGLRFMLSLPN